MENNNSLVNMEAMKIFFKHLFKGIVKDTPIVGGICEEVIFNAVDAENAALEAAKLWNTLGNIQQQNATIIDILKFLKSNADFEPKINKQFDNMIIVSNNLDDDNALEQLRIPFENFARKNPKQIEQITPFVHNLPLSPIGKLFKGRDDKLAQLREKLNAGIVAITQPQAIHGLGGIGKTRLAVEYAWREMAVGTYSAVYFVSANSPAEIDTNLAALAAPGLLNLPEYGQQDQGFTLAAVRNSLSQSPKWLLIFDNVDTEEAHDHLKKYLPQLTRGAVLITSRLANYTGDISDTPINKLDENSAVDYLFERTEIEPSEKNKKAAMELAQALDGLPLALEQAAAYIKQRHIFFEDYLRDYNEKRAIVLAFLDKRLMEYDESVMTTWLTTEQQLSTPQRAILRLASFFAPDPIPCNVFEDHPKRIEEAANLLREADGPKATPDEPATDVRGMLTSLADSSMIALEGNAFTIHRLVQEAVRLRIPKQHSKQWAEIALNLLNDNIPNEPPPQDVRSWPLWEKLNAHVAVLVKHADNHEIVEPTARLIYALAGYMYAQTRFGEAENLYRRALEITEASLGSKHSKVAMSLSNLAMLLKDTNRMKEAEPLMWRALEISESVFGPEHPEVSTCLNNLASLLQNTNRLQEAEPLMRRALDIDEASSGPEHPNVAIRLNNLATLLYDTNRMKEAEPLLRRALEIDKESFGPHHPRFAQRLNNLAGLLYSTNRLQEVEPLLRRALKIDEASFGSEHPNVARDLNNLGELLRTTNRLEEAEPLLRRALEIDEASFGPEHPNVANRLNNLAGVLKNTNRLQEAEPLLRHALEIVEASFGPEHPNVAMHLNNLAGVLQDTNRFKEAEPLLRRALDIRTNSLGEDHPNTQTAKRNLEILLKSM
jgi:tetratricopeptide (TPR) repeat protein